MSFSLGDCQFRLEPVDNTVTQEQGKSLTMQWDIVGRNSTNVLTGALYLGKTEEANKRLYQSFPEPALQPSIVDYFGNDSKLEFTNDLYKVAVARLQYAHEGSYLLVVFLRTGKRAQSIITIKVVGKRGIICFKEFVQ